ncbi:MAG: hypothetical protein ACJ74H_09060, partial [Thermoanaerobaculia bacterium]
RSDVITITLFIGNDNAKGAAAIASGAALRTPDRELLRRAGIDARVRTRFELPGVSLAMRVLAALPIGTRTRIAKVIARIAKLFRFGTRGGWIDVNGLKLSSADQRLAILPIVFALEHLPPPGVHAPTVLNAEELIAYARRRGA